MRAWWGHREPVGVTASICSMTDKMVWNWNFGGASDQELKVLGPRVMDWYATHWSASLAARENIDAERVLDYTFKGVYRRPTRRGGENLPPFRPADAGSDP